MRPFRRQLAGLGARSTAEFRVVLVRAILSRHDELAVGEERVVLTVGMNEDAWKRRVELIERNAKHMSL